MRRFARAEIRDVYHEYVNHLQKNNPLEYEKHERFFQRYAL